jgi:hypothetical protein
MILVASSLSLLVIAAGIFLYIKTVNYELSRFIRIAASFLIVLGFMNFFAAGAMFIVKGVHSFFDKENCIGNNCMKHSHKKAKKFKFKTKSCCLMVDDVYNKSMNCDGHSEMMMDLHSGKSFMMKDKRFSMNKGAMMKKDSMYTKNK